MSGFHLRTTAITVPCPRCGSAIRTSYGRVIVEATVSCPRGHTVRLVDNNDSARRLDRSLTDPNRQLRRLGRRR